MYGRLTLPKLLSPPLFGVPVGSAGTPKVRLALHPILPNALLSLLPHAEGGVVLIGLSIPLGLHLPVGVWESAQSL